jgi:hypothetical protein
MTKRELVIDLILVSDNQNGSNPEVYCDFIHPQYDEIMAYRCDAFNNAQEEYPWVRMVTVTTKV